MRTRHKLASAAVATALAATGLPAAAVNPSGGAAGGQGVRVAARSAPTTHDVLIKYATRTWRSMAAMVNGRTGLVSDNIGGDLDRHDRSAFTSPTNIGAYMWSAVAAREIGLLSRWETRTRIAQTLDTLRTLEIHEPSGMFYNWYDPATGKKLTTWPVDGSEVYPFLSSVDNAWLATALDVVKKQVPRLASKADAIVDKMDFGYYYDSAENQIRGGFWITEQPGSVPGNYRGGDTVYYTGHHYGALNTEPRMASYLGIAAGQIPAKHYFGTYRTFPNDNCDWSWTEQKAVGEWREYLGVRVFEGAYRYRGTRMVPTWGGSMFEALMVPLFVPEERWGQDSWALTHPTYVKAQIAHGMEEAGYGYWGFSPSNDPAGGYREYGVDQIGMNPDGYTSDEERTLVDKGYGDCRPALPKPESYGEGVVTPHASFLALRYAPKAALENLANIRHDFGAFGPGGFYDAVNVTTGEMSQRYLSLDQGMIMAALGNRLADNALRAPFTHGPMARRVAPLMRMEEFAGVTGGAG